VLEVGEGKYVVVAREHNVTYVQDHFPLQADKSANPELVWLHKLLGRHNDNDILQDDGRSNLDPLEEEEAAFDPLLPVPEAATCTEDDSDGLDSDEEVKAVMEQLDESVPLLSEYTRAVVDPGVSQGADDSARSVEKRQREQDGHGVDTSGRRDETAEDRPTRGPKRYAGGMERDAINSAEFRARPILPNPIDRAKTIDTITEKELRANKTLLIGRKIKRYFPQLGGSWALVESYYVDTDTLLAEVWR
jgi:hypothetical protein